MSLLLKSLTRLDTRPLSAAPAYVDTSQILLTTADPASAFDAAARDLEAVESAETNLAPAESAISNQSVEPENNSPSRPVVIAKLEDNPSATLSNATADGPTTSASAAGASSQSLTELERLLAVELQQPALTIPSEPSVQPTALLPLIPAPTPIENPAPNPPIATTPATIAPTAILPLPALLAKPLHLRQEFNDLRDHLLTKFLLKPHATILFIDAGRTPTDASWLVPFALSLLDHLTTQQQARLSFQSTITQPATPRILLIEAAGPQSEIARSIGLAARPGLAEIASGELKLADAIQWALHPNIQLLSAGQKQLGASQRTALDNLMPEIKNQFDLTLIATGPISDQPAASIPTSFPATAFFPLADAGILCVELNATPRLAAENAQRTLTAAGVNLLGCVVRQ